MFAEFKIIEENRRRFRDTYTPDLAKDREMYLAHRATVRAYLLGGQLLQTDSFINRKAKGWLACKNFFIPSVRKPGSADRYFISATATFPRPVPMRQFREDMIDPLDFVVELSGDHGSKVVATIPASSRFLPGGKAELYREAVFSHEVVDIIRREPYVAVNTTTWVPNNAE